ncbi:uncharacterized protein EDB93DRAFT_1101654 [Suillus bovinus]|uniref:uncharacterized protein n=1 Tax=Suillus bovinus TaxID=48563 RepID=UPI001B85D39F|nr:uncharacterized protein EDB93DRAFT_1101654 [Suillus bovinus]KAG2155875.1 hypothetical protein EDB93DRAFT_1101654 [Suillus bovinus]
MYASLEVHTEDTIKNGQEALSKLTELITKPNEKMHGPLKDAYQDHTNFKNFAEQILRYNHDSLIAEYIRNKLDHLDTQNLSMSNSEDQPDTALQETNDIDVDSTEPTDAQHFSLGSKQVAVSFTHIEAGSPAYHFQVDDGFNLLRATW